MTNGLASRTTGDNRMTESNVTTGTPGSMTGSRKELGHLIDMDGVI
jgi:hypothetical protein